MKKRILVLIVDDSALVRQALREVISSDSLLEVIGAVDGPFEAVKKIREVLPDVLILDIEMPGMDGLTFLKKVMKQHPIPTVICSSLAQSGSAVAMKALEYGAVDVIAKPNIANYQFFEEEKVRICDAIRAAAFTKLKTGHFPLEIPEKLTADAIIASRPIARSPSVTEKIVAIGASTGGTEALRAILTKLPNNSPGIVIVQHMPEFFTEQFSRRLNEECDVEVVEAYTGCVVHAGRVVVAHGNKHLLLVRKHTQYSVEVRDGPLVCRHRPSVDVLFRSFAQNAQKNGLGILLTGMGDDGALGLLEMRQAGAITIAQDEKTCVVFGMPNEAIKLNAVDQVLPLQAVPSAILKYANSQVLRTKRPM
jgi:two-component system chemotaxis response regulator CheB